MARKTITRSRASVRSTQLFIGGERRDRKTMEFLRTLFSSGGFMPHGFCYLWSPGLVWLHAGSDSLIALAYSTIPVTLVYFIRKRRDMPFNWMFISFGIFILACGATHAMEVWTLWHATYWLSGAVKLVTAIASVTTAIMLVHIVPQALALPSPETLRLEVAERKLAEEALSKANGRLIKAHEEERARIARELHDDINQRVALLAMQLDRMRQDLPDSAADLRHDIGEANKQMSELGDDIQALSHRLHSSKLEYLGLAAAVAGFCRELSDRHGVEIDFHSEGIPKELPHEISLCFFRVLQEALQNATKHSGSRRFEVSLTGALNELNLTVCDLGTGFDFEGAVKGNGLGLISMKERMKLVGGELSIKSQPQLGTTIYARVALSPEKSAGTAG
jgi:signal transduction histidine kinase